MRTIAKLVRKARGAPSLRLHGYAVERDRVSELVRTLTTQPLAQRRRIAGMPPERSDIISAGALIVQAVVEATGARSLLVSGQGLREGVAYEAFRIGKSPVVREVRRAGVDAFRERYVTGALRQFTHEIRRSATRPSRARCLARIPATAPSRWRWLCTRNSAPCFRRMKPIA